MAIVDWVVLMVIFVGKMGVFFRVKVGRVKFVKVMVVNSGVKVNLSMVKFFVW